MNKVKASLAVLGITAAAVLGMAASIDTGRSVPVGLVQTCQVQLGQVEQVLALDGTLRFETEYAAIAPVTGVVESVYVQVGEAVQAGQALFRLNDRTQTAAIAAVLAGQEKLPSAMGEEIASVRVQEAAAQLESLTVRAATDGLVQQVNVSPYSGVAAGTAAMLLSGRTQFIQCSAVLKDAESLHPGMQARIIKNGELLTMATVKSIGPAQTDAATGQTVCLVDLTPAENIDRPLGALVEVEVILQGRADVPVLPVQAITEQETVWWVAEGRSYEVPVQVLMADEVQCWVNLPEGMQVVCDGEKIVQGQQVKEMEP